MTTRTDLLASIPLFSRTPKKTLERIASLMVERDFPAGADIVQEGQRGVAFFVIADGSVEVSRGSESKHLAALKRGDYFGEMSLIDGDLRSASVRAIEPTRCFAMTQWDFTAELRSEPALALHLLQGLSGHVRTLEMRLADTDAPI
jgi:CRP-like cAMP-binding protein